MPSRKKPLSKRSSRWQRSMRKSRSYRGMNEAIAHDVQRLNELKSAKQEIEDLLDYGDGIPESIQKNTDVDLKWWEPIEPHITTYKLNEWMGAALVGLDGAPSGSPIVQMLVDSISRLSPPFMLHMMIIGWDATIKKEIIPIPSERLIKGFKHFWEYLQNTPIGLDSMGSHIENILELPLQWQNFIRRTFPPDIFAKTSSGESIALSWIQLFDKGFEN